MGEKETKSGFFGMLAVGMAVCCGLPLLASAGVLGAAAGLGFGSLVMIVAGSAVTLFGLWRWRQPRDVCEISASDEVSNYEADVDDRAV